MSVTAVRRLLLVLPVLIAAPAASPASAGIVRSGNIDAVAVTIYRDPDRGPGAMDRRWPGGYALITETRTLTLPEGESVIRFEGVADGLLPESAIVTGLPAGVREKNRDARLLSPGALVDAYLKRRVTLTRTDPATGKVSEQQAVIQSGPGDGVLIETAQGIEALRCSGLPERLSYEGVPDDLSAKPTFSVLVNNDRPRTVTVQLSYLAEGFDWNAHYIADRAADDPKRLSLFGWATLANGGTTSFAQARVQLIAGKVNRTGNREAPRAQALPLRLSCWPMDTTSTHAGHIPAPPPAPPPAPMMMDAVSEIVVTAMRRSEGLMMAPVAAMKAEQEQLGDLKLYRVPEPVTVAAQGQKQVAMIVQPRVETLTFHTADARGETNGSQPMTIALRSSNVADKGLGVPLPAGGVAIFEPIAGRALLAGEAQLDDKAVGDEVELVVGASPDVRWQAEKLGANASRQDGRLTLTNARDRPAQAEVTIPYDLVRLPRGVAKKDGVPTWRITVPAQGTVTLDYAIRLVPEGR